MKVVLFVLAYLVAGVIVARILIRVVEGRNVRMTDIDEDDKIFYGATVVFFPAVALLMAVGGIGWLVKSALFFEFKKKKMVRGSRPPERPVKDRINLKNGMEEK